MHRHVVKIKASLAHRQQPASASIPLHTSSQPGCNPLLTIVLRMMHAAHSRPLVTSSCRVMKVLQKQSICGRRLQKTCGARLPFCMSIAHMGRNNAIARQDKSWCDCMGDGGFCIGIESSHLAGGQDMQGRGLHRLGPCSHIPGPQDSILTS